MQATRAKIRYVNAHFLEWRAVAVTVAAQHVMSVIHVRRIAGSACAPLLASQRPGASVVPRPAKKEKRAQAKMEAEGSASSVQKSCVPFSLQIGGFKINE